MKRAFGRRIARVLGRPYTWRPGCCGACNVKCVDVVVSEDVAVREDVAASEAVAAGGGVAVSKDVAAVEYVAASEDVPFGRDVAASEDVAILNVCFEIVQMLSLCLFVYIRKRRKLDAMS